jgi:hypothetical protein
VLEG